jgi:hypothetical protein
MGKCLPFKVSEQNVLRRRPNGCDAGECDEGRLGRASLSLESSQRVVLPRIASAKAV